MENPHLILFLPVQNNVVKIYLTVFLDQRLCKEDYSCLGNRSKYCLGAFSYFRSGFVCLPIKINYFLALIYLKFLKHD